MVLFIDAATLTSIIEYAMVRMKLQGPMLSLGKDAVNILKKEPRAFYTHCYGHALNLADGDAIHGTKMRDSLTVQISKLVKHSYSKRRDVESQKKEMSPQTPWFSLLCPKGWTVKAKCLKSVLDNYSLWKSACESCRARTVGVKVEMNSFDFLFGVSFTYAICRDSGYPSSTLHHEDLSACDGQAAAKVTVSILSSR
ncbi:hypothetical protein MAR_020564 [Mya arenaria]|uniref:DUF4371 domain-containing protein n=1 Tax=Mya arenaria TaxID=6604 RepID=A0ABY7E592_MYAAR|nr:hypothetical protein MAR_020564 [Mya arenaria]